MIIAYIPVVAGIVGILIYVLAVNGKAQEIGRILFACGTLVSLFEAAGHVVRIP